MIRDLTIRNFRGFEHLEVKGLGRVNLIIGRNDTGKTSLMGAAAFAAGPLGLVWAPNLAHPQLQASDFERVWRPMFHGGQLGSPINLSAVTDADQTLNVEITTLGPQRGSNKFVISYLANGLETRLDSAYGFDPNPVTSARASWWSCSAPDPEEDLIEPLTRIYGRGELGRVAEAMRTIHPTLERVDIVGNALYVVFAGMLPLPLTVLGDGSRRILEFAIANAEVTTCFIDEIENGFHWSTLTKVWTLLRTSQIGQTFATTHREENIRIACENFLEAGDDGLRIVRLDRTDAGHRAVVYTAEAALAAMDAGLEIRG